MHQQVIFWAFMKVIIGAGPAGLYTAIKLKQAHIEDVVVYDPRANQYNRPGHLNKAVFIQAEQGLQFKFWHGGNGHIKDLERALFKKAQELGIKIENKRFLRLHQDAKSPGVVVAYEGQEEIIAADYVFDCTGGKRAVVTAVNQINPQSPLQLTAITELPVQNHFIAYVKMDPADWSRFSVSSAITYNSDTDLLDAGSFAHVMIKLRALGWKELSIPRCYGQYFGKNKVCLYMHAPESLDVENHDLWVQTVLEAYTYPISYQRLPPSTKPRFTPFTLKAEALQRVSFKGQNSPTVIALGDAQIDSDYRLAHGILDGMKRIDALFRHMDIIDGKIFYFDAEEYYEQIALLLQTHKKEVIAAANTLRKTFINALTTGTERLEQAQCSDISHQTAFNTLLQETKLRQKFNKGCDDFAKFHDKQHQINLDDNLDILSTNCTSLHSNLLAGLQLPDLLVKEKQQAKTLCTHLAVSWKEIGNALFKNNRIHAAVDAYNNALELYDALDTPSCALNKMIVYSNLTIAYARQGQDSELITNAKTALAYYEHYEQIPEAALQCKKIVFHWVMTLINQSHQKLAAKSNDAAQILYLRAKALINTYSKTLKQDENKLQTHLAQLEKLLPPEPHNMGNEQEQAAAPHQMPLLRKASMLLSNWGLLAREESSHRRRAPIDTTDEANSIKGSHRPR